MSFDKIKMRKDLPFPNFVNTIETRQYVFRYNYKVLSGLKRKHQTQIHMFELVLGNLLYILGIHRQKWLA